MEMTDRERIFIGVPLLIGMITIGILTLFIAVGAVDAAFWWSLFLSLGCAVAFLVVVWADRRASLRRAVRMRGGVPMETLHDDIETWIPITVLCAPEIYDEMKQALAEGWRLTQVPGHADTVSAAEDPRIAADGGGIDGPHGYRTTLEKPRER